MCLVYVKEPTLSLKINSKLCICVSCNSTVEKNNKICRYHRYQKYKHKNPYSYAYSVLKNNAKRRKIPFELTKDEFIDFCKETGYMELKGRFKDSMTIDRIIPSIGYRRNNIQILSNSNNVRKMLVESKIRLGKYPNQDEIKSIIDNQIKTEVQSNDCPF